MVQLLSSQPQLTSPLSSYLLFPLMVLAQKHLWSIRWKETTDSISDDTTQTLNVAPQLQHGTLDWWKLCWISQGGGVHYHNEAKSKPTASGKRSDMECIWYGWIPWEHHNELDEDASNAKGESGSDGGVWLVATRPKAVSRLSDQPSETRARAANKTTTAILRHLRGKRRRAATRNNLEAPKRENVVAS